MGFRKGTSGNPAGRPPGSKNVASIAGRDTLLQFVTDYIEGGQAAQDWQKMKPRERWQVITKLAGVLVPRETIQKVNVNTSKPMSDEELQAEIARLREVVEES